MPDQRTTAASLVLACLLLLAASGLHAQGRVPPVPFFKTAAQMAKADAYRDALDDVAAYLCLEPKEGRSRVWEEQFSELETKLIVAEHELIWSAAGGGFGLTHLSNFHDARAEIVAQMDRLIPHYPALRPFTAKIRDSENQFSSTDRKFRGANMIFSVLALRTMMYDFDRDVRSKLPPSEVPVYLGLMKKALEHLGAAQFAVYDQGSDEVNAKVPVEATFPFALHLPSDGNEARTYTALAKSFLDLAGINGVNVGGIASFDAEFRWERIAPFAPAPLSSSIRQEIKGPCQGSKVTVTYNRSRTDDALRVEKALLKHNYTPVMYELPSGRRTVGTRFFRRIAYQRNGTQAGAQFIKTLIGDVDKFRIFAGTPVSTPLDDYTVWLLDKSPPQKNVIDMIFTNERSDDATIASEILEDNGYKVVRRPLDESGLVLHRPKKIVFRGQNGGYVDEARDIAFLVHELEEVEPFDDGPIYTKDLPPYEVWITTKKEQAAAINLNGMWLGYDYNCPNDPSIQEIRITQTGNEIKAVKISGNKCIGDGEVTFRGQLSGRKLTGEMQMAQGSTKSFSKVGFIIENDDLIVINVNGKIKIRRRKY